MMSSAAATGSIAAAAAASPPPPPPPAAPPRGGRKSASLPAETVEYLKSWMMSPDHVAHPYPTEQEKAAIMADTGIELKQLTNWFVNNRKRYWKPRVEAGTVAATAGGGGGRSAMIATAGAAAASSSSSLDLHRRTQQANDDYHDRQPAVAVPAAVAAAPYQDLDGRMRRGPIADADDPHTISEGSGSSACDDSGDENDDDSYRSEQRSRCSSMSASFDSSSSSSSASSSSSRLRSDDDPSSPSSSPSSAAATSVAMAEGYRRHEEVDVYVLRPEEGGNHPASSPSSSHPALASDAASDAVGGGAAEPLPTIRDLTIKSSVPKERILATFKCPISYTIPYDIENDKRRVQSRRDGEVLRAKKHYLKLYLASRGVHVDAQVGGGATGTGDDAPDFDDAAAAADVVGAPPVGEPGAPSPSTASRPPGASPPIVGASSYTRDASRDAVPPAAPPPRKRARASPDDADEWRMLCRNARGGAFCESLPGLEEASRMFGFSSP